MPRPLTLHLAVPFLCFLCACPGGGAGGGEIAAVPPGGCEADPFAGTCVAEFVHGDGCWDAAGHCSGTLVDLYWENGASLHSDLSYDLSSVETEVFGTTVRCFAGSSPIVLGAPNLPITGTYTRDSDGARMSWRVDGNSVVYTCPDGQRVRAMFEQRECVYRDGGSQCDLEDLDAYSDL